MTPFTFTSAAGAGTSAAAGAITGGVTPWYRISDRTKPSSYTLSGTFVAGIKAEFSNASGFDKGDDFVQDDGPVHDAKVLRELPVGVADFVRYRCLGYTSGAPKISHAKAIGADGAPFVIPEDTFKTPTPSSAGS